MGVNVSEMRLIQFVRDRSCGQIGDEYHTPGLC
jgi:hypothetical protein